jgi:hypothetical protein
MARPFFSRDRVTDLERFDRHIQEAIALMKQRMGTGYAVDFQDLIQRTTMALATEFLFGAAVNSLQISVEDLPQPFNHPDYQASVQAFSKNPANEFSEAFLRAQTVAAERDRAGWVWPLTELFEDRVKKDMKTVNSFVVPFVEKAIRNNEERIRANGGAEQGKREVEDDESFLDHLASQTSGNLMQHLYPENMLMIVLLQTGQF